jgi:D-alanine-D-alanine ligase
VVDNKTKEEKNMYQRLTAKNSTIIKTHLSTSNKPHVVLLMGGLSTEKEVSITSGTRVMHALEELDYHFTAVDMGRDIPPILSELKPAVVFNALHGTYGEDGCIAGVLELMAIPYTHSSVMACAIAMNKAISKELFKASNIKCAPHFIMNKSDNYQQDPMPRPYVIKPIAEGSSVGVELVFADDDFDIRNYKFPYGDAVIVEQYIKGRELQVAIFADKAIGALEIVPSAKFNDYTAKYTQGMSHHINPAKLSAIEEKKLFALAEKAHKILGCRDISRVEFIQSAKDGEFYILEVNTHPGLTPLSSYPEILESKGISFNKLVAYLIEKATLDYSSR